VARSVEVDAGMRMKVGGTALSERRQWHTSTSHPVIHIYVYIYIYIHIY
jgi:hypothetical protein